MATTPPEQKQKGMNAGVSITVIKNPELLSPSAQSPLLQNHQLLKSPSPNGKSQKKKNNRLKRKANTGFLHPSSTTSSPGPSNETLTPNSSSDADDDASARTGTPNFFKLDDALPLLSTPISATARSHYPRFNFVATSGEDVLPDQDQQSTLSENSAKISLWSALYNFFSQIFGNEQTSQQQQKNQQEILSKNYQNFENESENPKIPEETRKIMKLLAMELQSLKSRNSELENKILKFEMEKILAIEKSFQKFVEDSQIEAKSDEKVRKIDENFVRNLIQQENEKLRKDIEENNKILNEKFLRIEKESDKEDSFVLGNEKEENEKIENLEQTVKSLSKRLETFELQRKLEIEKEKERLKEKLKKEDELVTAKTTIKENNEPSDQKSNSKSKNKKQKSPKSVDPSQDGPITQKTNFQSIMLLIFALICVFLAVKLII